MLSFTLIKLVVRVLACVRAIAHIKWRRLLCLLSKIEWGQTKYFMFLKAYDLFLLFSNKIPSCISFEINKKTEVCEIKGV